METAGSVEIVHYTDVGGTAMNISGALRLQGRKDRVVALPGNLSVGPIDQPDPDARQEWFRTVLRYDPDDEHREADWFEADGFEAGGPWIEATSGLVHPVCWVCLTDARAHASCLAFADRMAGRPFDIIDATGLSVTNWRGVRTPRSIFEMSPKDIITSGLEDRRRPFTRVESEVARAAWARLREENAPLRIMRDGALVSAPLTYFDAFLTQQATPEWEMAAKLIGRTMSYCATGMQPPGQNPSVPVLFGRMLALGDAGALEVIGPGPDMRDYDVRAPLARQVA